MHGDMNIRPAHEIRLGDALTVLRSMESESVQCCVTSPLSKKEIGDVLSAMNPRMAVIAKCNEIRWIKPQVGKCGKAFYMVGVKFIGCSMGRLATLTVILVAFINQANQSLPFSRRIKPLAFRRSTAFPVWVACSSSARHSVSFATQIRLWNACFFAETLPSFRRVRLALKSVRDFATGHPFAVAIRSFQIQSAWTCRYLKISQFLIDVFRIARHEAANFIGRKLLDNIFLMKPISV